MQNQKISKIKRDLLIDENQKTINDWLKNALPIIAVDPKLARGLKKSDNTSWEKVQALELSVELENKDLNRGIDETEISVHLVGRAEWDKKIFKVLKIQSKTTDVAAGKTNSVTFAKLKNYYSATRGFHALNYVVHITRKSDGKLIYLGSDNSVLTKRASEIIALSEGDVVKSDYTTKLSANDRQYSSQTDVQ